jgi:hypothetical protein
MKKPISLTGLLVTFFCLSIQNVIYSQDKFVVKNKIETKAYKFDLKDVRLLDGEFKKAMQQNHKYLIDMDVNRLLHNFRINAGLKSSAKPFGGWEEPQVELRGHFTGHFLTACALLYSSTGDKRFIAKVDSIVNGLEECQTVLNKNGYLSAYPEELIDRVETGIRVWAPYYTLHKIFAGLIDVYVHMNNGKALDVCEKMAMWVKLRTDKLAREKIQKMLRVEFGGMNEMFYNLYSLTGKAVYEELAKRFEDKFVFDPLSRKEDKLRGLHANTQIPKVIGAARAYELTGDEYYGTIAKYFWDEVTKTRSYATGGTSNFEYWRSEPNHLFDQLSSDDHENCCTYNMLKLTSHLFSLEPKAEYADYYERALLNGIMGTQHPETGGAFMYSVPMLPGSWRIFCEPEYSYVCCSGTGIESFGKFGDNIYFHNSNSLFVNLFIPSTVDWKEKNISLTQKTNFPDEQETTLTISTNKAQKFILKLRVPYWAASDYSVFVNGEKQNVSADLTGYANIERVWNNNDKVEIRFPFKLHLMRMADYPNRTAILYGPVVLAARLGQKQMNAVMINGMGEDVERLSKEAPALPVPKFVTDETNLSNWIKPVNGKSLTFSTANAGTPNDVTLIPFYRLQKERYSVYFDVYSKKEWKNFLEQKVKIPEGAIDRFVFGDKFSNDEHNYQAWISEKGETAGRKWVKSKSWFRFDINVVSDKPVILRTTYFGDESQSEYHLSIDGIQIPTKKIDKNGDEFFTVDYELPFEMTKGKERIGIQFKVPEKKKEVSVGQTTVEKTFSIYETPKLFECETRVR